MSSVTRTGPVQDFAGADAHGLTHGDPESLPRANAESEELRPIVMA